VQLDKPAPRIVRRDEAELPAGDRRQQVGSRHDRGDPRLRQGGADIGGVHGEHQPPVERDLDKAERGDLGVAVERPARHLAARPSIAIAASNRRAGAGQRAIDLRMARAETTAADDPNSNGVDRAHRHHDNCRRICRAGERIQYRGGEIKVRMRRSSTPLTVGLAAVLATVSDLVAKKSQQIAVGCQAPSEPCEQVLRLRCGVGVSTGRR
jgi:hypothetical protein